MLAVDVDGVAEDARADGFRASHGALYNDEGATLKDLREAVITLEELERTARRVFGSAHPLTEAVAAYLQDAQAALRAREETPPTSA